MGTHWGMPSGVAFEYLAHVLTVPVTVGDVGTRFVRLARARASDWCAAAG